MRSPERMDAREKISGETGMQNWNKELGDGRKTSCVIRSYSETVVNPMPGYD
jgi:hypothetical protein